METDNWTVKFTDNTFRVHFFISSKQFSANGNVPTSESDWMFSVRLIATIQFYFHHTRSVREVPAPPPTSLQNRSHNTNSEQEWKGILQHGLRIFSKYIPCYFVYIIGTSVHKMQMQKHCYIVYLTQLKIISLYSVKYTSYVKKFKWKLTIFHVTSPFLCH